MGKQNFLFVVFCLVLLSGIMQSYMVFEKHFSPEKSQQKKIAKLERQITESKILLAQAQLQYADLQQELAEAMPPLQSIEKTVRKFPLRNIASVSQVKIEGIDLSGVIMERAKSEFRKKDYALAIQSFKNLIEKYPASVKVVEAYFFVAESLFLSQKYPDCLEVIDKMMVQFPEHELTGFIMLRMGQILQQKNRPDEAIEVFRTVEVNFKSNFELRDQAIKLAKAVE